MPRSMSFRFGWLCSAAILLASATAFAAPRWVRITLPPEQPATGMVVAWNSDAMADASTVEYGTSAGALTQSQVGASFTAKGALGVVHEVTLTSLKPGTTYHYRVGGAGAWSPVHTFKTAPTEGCGPFKFIASGDHRSDDNAGPNPKWKSILGEMAATGATFILETGDLVKDGADLKQWQNHMEMGAAHMGEVALMPTFGNHDSDDVQGASAAFNQLFSLPTNASTGTEDFYAFEYGEAVFVAMTTATYADAAGLAMQAKWLDETLTKHANKTWKFVYFHHPCYTSSIDLKIIDLNHPANEKGQNTAFLPVFDKHHVDIVFAGHNHFYERFAPIKGGSPVASTQAGTVYITTGGAGAFTYDTIDVFGFKIEPMKIICGDGILGMSGKAKGSQFCTGKHHYVEVAIDKHVLTATVRATSAQNFSDAPANKAVIETFQIVKPANVAGNCSPLGADAGSTDAGSTDAGGADTAGAADTVQAADVVTEPDTVAAPDTTATSDTVAAPDSAEAPDATSADAQLAADVLKEADGAEADVAAGTDAVAPEDSGTVAKTDAATGSPSADVAGKPNGIGQDTTTTTPTPASSTKGQASGCSAASGSGSQAGLGLLGLAAILAVRGRRRWVRN